MMNDTQRDRITNGRNGDHVSIIDPNCQRRLLDRSCDFHAIKFGQEQETPMLDKPHTSANMPAIGTPPRFTEFSVLKPSTRLNSSCVCAVVDHVCHETVVPHLSFTFAERAATTQEFLNSEIPNFRIQIFRHALKMRVLR